MTLAFPPKQKSQCYDLDISALALPPKQEAYFIMTQPRNRRDRYWHIKAPQRQFPKSKFDFGQQVGMHWQDEDGNAQYDIGVIIGMQYGAKGYNRPEWAYLLRWLKCDSSPEIVGSDDGNFIYESSLVADFTPMDGEC